jgi:hypothetical protein
VSLVSAAQFDGTISVFRGLIDRLKIADLNAIEVQRIACLLQELEFVRCAHRVARPSGAAHANAGPGDEARQAHVEPTKPAGGNTMRRFMVHLVTEVEFEDGDAASDKTVQNYEKHLSETVRNAAHGLSLRTVKGARLSSSNPRA